MKLFNLTLLFLFSLALNSNANPLPDYNLSVDAVEQLERGNTFSDISKGENGLTYVFGAVDVKAPPETLWAIMTDCSAQLNIVPNLKSCSVLESSLDKTWDRREQKIIIGFPLPAVRSEFRSDYTPFQSIKITRSGGDLSVLDGEWILEPLPSGQTRIAYQARMKSRLPVPARFIRKAVRKDMPLILINLRRKAEARSEDSLP